MPQPTPDVVGSGLATGEPTDLGSSLPRPRYPVHTALRAAYLATSCGDFDVIQSDDVKNALNDLAERCRRAAG